INRIFFCSRRRRHTRSKRDWSSDVCSCDLRKRTNTLLNDRMFNRNKVNNNKRFYKEGEFTLKDTTAILFHYSHSAFIYKALNSLKNIESRVKSIIVLQ